MTEMSRTLRAIVECLECGGPSVVDDSEFSRGTLRSYVHRAGCPVAASELAAPVMARIDAPIAQLLIPCPHCAGSFAPGSMHACPVRGQVVRMPNILT